MRRDERRERRILGDRLREVTPLVTPAGEIVVGALAERGDIRVNAGQRQHELIGMGGGRIVVFAARQNTQQTRHGRPVLPEAGHERSRELHRVVRIIESAHEVAVGSAPADMPEHPHGGGANLRYRTAAQALGERRFCRLADAQQRPPGALPSVCRIVAQETNQRLDRADSESHQGIVGSPRLIVTASETKRPHQTYRIVAEGELSSVVRPVTQGKPLSEGGQLPVRRAQA